MTKHQRQAVHDRASLYDDITNKIIGELEAGRLPRVQHWGTAAAKAPLAMPRNASTGRDYSWTARFLVLTRRPLGYRFAIADSGGGQENA